MTQIEKEVKVKEWMAFLREEVMTGKVKIYNTVTKSYALATDDVNIKGQAELLTELYEQSKGEGIKHLEFIPQN